MGKYMCHCFLYSLDAIFKEVFCGVGPFSDPNGSCMFCCGMLQIHAWSFGYFMYNLGDENTSFVFYIECR